MNESPNTYLYFDYYQSKDVEQEPEAIGGYLPLELSLIHILHPKQKREVGERLAAWALNKTYGYKNVIPSGPLYKSVVFSGGAAYISFDYAERCV